MHTFTSTVIPYFLQIPDLTLIFFYFNISVFSILVQASLRRLAIRDPDRCKNALKQLLKAGKTVPKWSLFYNTNVDKDDFMLAAKVDNMDCFDKREMYSLISNIYDSISESRSSKHNDGSSSSNQASTSDPRTESKSNRNIGNSGENDTIDSAQSLYFSVVKDFCYLTLPIFHMRCSSLHPGVQMSLTLFEPRYRMLVSEAMAGRKASELRGKLLKEPRPRFIFCHKRAMVHGSIVFIVEITRCRMMEAGRSQIMINPIKNVKMLKVRLRSGVSNNLMDGQIRRFE